METVAERIIEMQRQGWTVTFRPDMGKAAYAVRATRGDREEYTRGYRARGYKREINPRGEFEDAIERLYMDTLNIPNYSS